MTLREHLEAIRDSPVRLPGEVYQHATAALLIIEAAQELGPGDVPWGCSPGLFIPQSVTDWELDA